MNIKLCTICPKTSCYLYNNFNNKYLQMFQVGSDKCKPSRNPIKRDFQLMEDSGY